MNAKFLIAHPDTLTVNALELALRDERHNARVTHEGLDAIDRALDERPDAIILGLDLPGLSGLDVARALRALEPTRNIPILFIARNSEEATTIAHAGLPHVECLVGPIDMARLRAETTQMLRGNRTETELLSADGDEHLAEITDPVTGLYSRHYMLHRLAYESARSTRYKIPLACLLFDVENMDTLVHKLGSKSRDELLVETAEIFRHSGRNSDVVGRADQAEFLVVAPHTDEWAARRTALRMRALIREHHYSLPAPFDHIDVVVGYASSLGGSLAENLVLLARAEGALAEARTQAEQKIAGG